MTAADVIILSWDRVDDTIAAIESALTQTGVDHRVIVVDQGSKPDGLARLKESCAKDPRILLHCNTQNTGVPGGRNQASFLGKGRYIVALDNDAVFFDEHQLAKTVEMMDADEKLGVLAYRIMLYGEDRDDRSSWPYSERMEDHSTQRFRTVRFVGAGHAIRRSVFEQIGGYDDALFFLHEEVDLSKRILNAGYSIWYDPRVAVRHKVSAEHRVSWSGKRYYFDIRNKTYLHIKHRTRLLTFLFHTGLMTLKGFRSGYVLATLKGLGGAMLMLPRALKARWSDPYTKTTPESAAYQEACSPTAGWTVMQRVRMRLRDANKKVG